jgi:hypothetical protein
LAPATRPQARAHGTGVASCAIEEVHAMMIADTLLIAAPFAGKLATTALAPMGWVLAGLVAGTALVLVAGRDRRPPSPPAIVTAPCGHAPALAA